MFQTDNQQTKGESKGDAIWISSVEMEHAYSVTAIIAAPSVLRFTIHTVAILSKKMK